MQQLRILALLILAVSSAKSYSVTQFNGQTHTVTGDVDIIINSSTWKCGDIYCPRDTTDRCVVTKRNLPENQRIVRREIYCLSADNKTLNQFSEDQTVGENVLDSLDLTAYRDGSVRSISTNNNISEFDPEFHTKFNKSMQEVYQNLQENLSNLNKDLEKMQKQMQNSFPNMFNWG